MFHHYRGKQSNIDISKQEWLIAWIDADNVDELDTYLKANKDNLGTDLRKILYEASIRGKFRIVTYLIEEQECQADVAFLSSSLVSSYQGSLLSCAVKGGNLDLVKYLVEKCKLNLEDPPPKGMRVWDTPLKIAVEKKDFYIADYLISKGARINPLLEGGSISRLAISTGDLNILRLVVYSGGEIKEHDFDMAIKSKSLPVIEYFLEKFPGVENRFESCLGRQSTIFVVAESGSVPVLNYLIQRPSFAMFPTGNKPRNNSESTLDPRYELLLSGAKSRQVDMMRYLLEELKLMEVCANTDYRECYSYDVLSNVIGGSLSAGLTFVETRENDILASLRYLVEEKNFLVTKKQLDALIRKAKFLDIRVNAYLVSLSTDILNVERGILQDLALSGLNQMDLPSLLRLFSLDIIHDSRITLHGRISRFPIAEFESRLGDPQFALEALFFSASYLNSRDPSLLRYLLDYGMDPNQENHLGESLLNYAYKSGYGKIAEILIERGADAYRSDSSGFCFAERIQNRSRLETQVKELNEYKNREVESAFYKRHP